MPYDGTTVTIGSSGRSPHLLPNLHSFAIDIPLSVGILEWSFAGLFPSTPSGP